MPTSGLDVAERVAAGCGVTRLADITGLDRIGISVWQAVRPWSRSVSVHQGKGLDSRNARMSALVEAIECSHAEHWDGDTREARFADLPVAERAPEADDHAVATGAFDGATTIGWTRAERLDTGTTFWVPAASVSLDLTIAGPPGVERGSNGQGGGFTLAYASLKGLCELIERDAIAGWSDKGAVGRARDGIDRTSIAFSWFAHIMARLNGLDIGMRVFRVPAVIAMPVIAVELVDVNAEGAAHPSATGTCAHPNAEQALRGALIEAAQSRLTHIAGARDDLTLGLTEARPVSFGLGLSLPSGAGQPTFDALFAPTPSSDPQIELSAIAAALAHAGFPFVARVVLSPPECSIVTVKMFAPGLGAFQRRRR